jgi:hypothetical protein
LKYFSIIRNLVFFFRLYNNITCFDFRSVCLLFCMHISLQAWSELEYLVSLLQIHIFYEIYRWCSYRTQNSLDIQYRIALVCCIDYLNTTSISQRVLAQMSSITASGFTKVCNRTDIYRVQPSYPSQDSLKFPLELVLLPVETIQISNIPKFRKRSRKSIYEYDP